MILLKSSREIRLMRQSGKIAGNALLKAKKYIKPGISTAELDRIIHDDIISGGAIPSFLGYRVGDKKFPASACISLNHEVIHGIPSESVVLKEGDIVSIDVGALKNGYHGDCAETFMVGTVSPEAKKLVEITKQSFFEGIQHAKEGGRVSDIGTAIQEYVEKHGYSVVRQFVGHGLGQSLHEEPDVPNYYIKGASPRLCKGMTIAVEPMINNGSHEVTILDNGWTVVTRDGSLSAHFEHSIAITNGDPVILTLP